MRSRDPDVVVRECINPVEEISRTSLNDPPLRGVTSLPVSSGNHEQSQAGHDDGCCNFRHEADYAPGEARSWEHTFALTAQPHAHVRFRRAIERRALWLAEDAACELPDLPLDDALQLVHLYAERGSPKYERAAMRWLERYLIESTPRLKHFAEITTSLAKREPNTER
jgi:hypothetical protein